MKQSTAPLANESGWIRLVYRLVVDGVEWLITIKEVGGRYSVRIRRKGFPPEEFRGDGFEYSAAAFDVAVEAINIISGKI